MWFGTLSKHCVGSPTKLLNLSSCRSIMLPPDIILHHDWLKMAKTRPVYGTLPFKDKVTQISANHGAEDPSPAIADKTKLQRIEKQPTSFVTFFSHGDFKTAVRLLTTATIASKYKIQG